MIYEIGAHEGQSVRAYLNEIPEAQVWAFEPNPAVLPALNAGNDKRVTVQPCAIGSASGRARLKVRQDSRVSSMLDVEPELLRRSEHYRLLGEIDVDLHTIDSVVQEQGAPTPHLLRTMTRGYDLDVFRGASQVLASGEVLLVASELYFASAFVGQPQAHEVMGALAAFGYRLYGFDRLVEATSGTLYFGSGLFLSPKAWKDLGLL